MKNEKVLYGIIGLLLGVVLTWMFAVSAVNGNNFSMSRMMGFRSSTSMAGNVDEHFIDQMIPHHEDAITMSELALQKSEHQELKDMAKNIITTQNKEIEQMKNWRSNGFADLFVPTAYAHGMTHGLNMGMMGDDTDIEDLENAKPFDKKFIEEMIPHHQVAIMMSQMLWNTTQRDEMKQLAKEIISAQEQEISQMRTWYNQWYK